MAAWEIAIERGPSITLAEIGDKVGLSAATVVQQLGSKRNVMLGVTRLWTSWTSARLQGEGGPIEQILESYGQISLKMRTPQHVSNAAAIMYLDLADAEFRELIIAGFKGHRRAVKKALDVAIELGELASCDTDHLALQLQLTGHGAMQLWAIEPQGSLSDFIIECLESTLAPWRPDRSPPELLLDAERAAGVSRRP